MKAIMIVDDEFIILESLRMQINRIIGPDVILETASSAEEACREIAAIAGKGLDLRLVISDFNLDDGKGTEVLTFALNLYPGMLKVILSGQSDNKMISEFDEKYGLDAFIGKPWNFDEIDRLVHRAID
jgi:DNA-binding NtrC family response regulator